MPSTTTTTTTTTTTATRTTTLGTTTSPATPSDAASAGAPAAAARPVARGATTGWPSSHLTTAAVAFGHLTSEPCPVLVLHCAALPHSAGTGLEHGPTSLAVLRDWLLHQPHAHEFRDAVWAELVRRARTLGGPWTIGAVGMALPALLAMATDLANTFRADHATREDIGNELLAGFLTPLLRRENLPTRAPHAALTRAAWRAAHDMLTGRVPVLSPEDIEFVAAGPRAPKMPYGHPDLLVARAGDLGVIDPEDVAPWIEVRLAHRDPTPIAAGLGITVDALRMRLGRADTAIAAALAAGDLSDTISTASRRELDSKTKARLALRARAHRAATTARIARTLREAAA
jgi:hypothetical protein